MIPILRFGPFTPIVCPKIYDFASNMSQCKDKKTPLHLNLLPLWRENATQINPLYGFYKILQDFQTYMIDNLSTELILIYFGLIERKKIFSFEFPIVQHTKHKKHFL